MKANAFQANDSCIGCGQCVKKCPLNNIHLEQESLSGVKIVRIAWPVFAIARKKLSSMAKEAWGTTLSFEALGVAESIV